MRILHLDSGREMRGGQWQALRLIDGLRLQGFECTLLAARGSPLFQKAREAGIDARPLNWWTLARIGHRWGLVHAHDGRTHTLAAALGIAPLVVSRRVAFPIRSPWKYRRANRCAAVSQFVKRVMIEGGVPEERIGVVYDGVPPRPLAAAGDRVLAPASGDPLKGTEVALEAASRAGVHLHLSRDLESDLPSARLFVYLTHTEGLGSAVLMAMAAGVPVIASNTGGLPEIIRDGENGLLAENEPEPVAAAIRLLLEDAALARRLAICGRQTVAEKFSVESMIHNTIQLYRQVLSC
jgi:hypothetical protein